MRGLNLYIINGFYWITVSFYLPFITMFFAQKGMNSIQIGFLSSLLPIAALVVQPAWARLADRTGQRRRLLLILNLCCAGAVLFFLKAETFAGIAAAAGVYALFNSAVLPICDALVVNRAEEKRIDFAKIRMCGTISYAVVVLGVGFYLKEHINFMFYGSSICFLLFAASCATLPKDRELRSGGKENRQRESGQIFRSKDVAVILLFAFAMQFGVNYYAAFLGVYLLDLGFSQSLLGVLNCISALSEIPVLLVIYRLSRRYRETALLMFAVCCMALRLILLSAGSVPFMVAAQILQGPSYMVCYFVCVTYINRMVLPGKIAQGQSILSVVQMGLGSLSGSLLGGLLADAAGIRNGFLIVACLLLLIAAGAGIAIRRMRRE